jgi:hypothetical protein
MTRKDEYQSGRIEGKDVRFWRLAARSLSQSPTSLAKNFDIAAGIVD